MIQIAGVLYVLGILYESIVSLIVTVVLVGVLNAESQRTWIARRKETHKKCREVSRSSEDMIKVWWLPHISVNPTCAHGNTKRSRRDRTRRMPGLSIMKRTGTKNLYREEKKIASEVRRNVFFDSWFARCTLRNMFRSKTYSLLLEGDLVVVEGMVVLSR